MELIVVCLTAFFVAALTLYSGFGLGTLLMPAFAFFFPLETAIAATAIVHLSNNVLKVFLVGRKADPRVTVRFALPAAAAAFVGAALLVYLGELPAWGGYEIGGREFHVRPIGSAIGCLIVIFAVIELSPAFAGAQLPVRFIPLGGILSGFFGGLSGHQGALRSMFLIRAGLSKEAFIGTTVVSAVIVDVSRLAVYGTAIIGAQLGELRAGGHVQLVVLGTASAMLGTFLATRLLKKVTMSWVQRIVGVLLLVIGTGMILGIV